MIQSSYTLSKKTPEITTYMKNLFSKQHRTRRNWRIVTSFLFVFILNLTYVHAQSRLTPIDGTIFYGEGVHTDYLERLKSLLLPRYYKFAYVVTPSFYPEYSLIGTDEGDSLILRKAENCSIWSDLTANTNNKKKANKVSIKEYKLHVSSAVLDSISVLFNSAVLSSSYISRTEGCDGTTYTFISWPHTAECWSPSDSSNCGKLVAIAETICKAVMQQDSKSIQNCLKDVSLLHNTFTTLYDKKPTLRYEQIIYQNDETHFQGFHFIGFLIIACFFFIIIGIGICIYLLTNKKKRKYWWIPLVTTITISFVILTIAFLYITLLSIEI